MPTWGVGDDHDSEEVRSLKDQLRVKDAAHATLKGEQLKKEAEMKEIQHALTEAMVKLRQEADRILQLEADLQRRNEELSNERLTRANAEVALTTAERRLKESEQQALELQANLDTLSNHANSTSQGRSKLEQENSSLRDRIRAMERELQNKTHAEETALRQSHGPSGIPRHRRQPSETYNRIPALEKELTELRATSARHASDLQRTSEQLTKTREELVKVQNEKIASERRLQRQLTEAKAAVEDREDDLRLLRNAHGDGDIVARESDLLERLEEEEKRVAALENELARSSGSRKRDLAMLQDELDRTTKLLEEANKNAAVAENRIAELTRERGVALCDRDQLQHERDRLSSHIQAASLRISELEQSQPLGDGPQTQAPDEQTAAHFEKLLNTIARLRGERDQLRCDIEFLNAESRFAKQSLEERLAVATSVPSTPAGTSDATTIILQGYIQAFHEQADRNGRAASALAVVAQYASAREEEQTSRAELLAGELSNLRSSLHQTEEALQERQRTIVSLEQQLSSNASAIGDSESQAIGLRATIQHLEEELVRERNCHAETGAALSDTETQLSVVTEALGDAEAARDALALEKTHLESDLHTARMELADVEAEHSEQLAALSSMEHSGQGNQAVLRACIADLEARVERRTEQIGIHQHDIKRLELNMKLQEERVVELTQELEVVQNEKIAMLEDCRTTREERDDAMRRCDELEEAMEGIEEAREQEVGAMVQVSFAAFVAKRDAIVRSRQTIFAIQGDRAQLQARIQAVEAEKASLSAQIGSLAVERDQLAQAMDVSQSSAQSQLEEVATRAHAADNARAAAEAELASAHLALEAKDKELASLQNQLVAARANHEDRQSLEASIFAQEKESLESQLQQVQASRAELETLHQDAMEGLKRVEDELRRAEDELATHLANSAAQSETEERLREEIAQIRRQHAEEAAALQEQLRSLNEELEVMTHHRGETDAEKNAVQEELARTKQQLEIRLAEAGETLDTASRLQAELEQLKSAHDEEIRSMQVELDALMNELQETTQRRDELQELQEQTLCESQQRFAEASEVQQKVGALEHQLAELHASHKQEVQELNVRLEDADNELQAAKMAADSQQRDVVDDLTLTVEELKDRITVLEREAAESRAELEEEKAAHTRMRESTTADLRETIAMRDEAEAALAQAESELPTLRAQLEHAETTLREIEEEKLNLQYQTTNMEADLQRAKSLQRFLESQVAEGERRVVSMEAELSQLRAKCTSLDKLAQTTEANLAMQTIQHEQTVASLRRELNQLRSQPSVEDEILDLKERNAEYEELLRAKCMEIEENDDKFIDMLKEKKKLNSKIDSLSRKVQTLQNKLAAATEAAPRSPHAPLLAPAAPIVIPTSAPVPKHPAVFSPSVLAPAAIITSSSSSSSTSRTMSRQRVVTAPAMQAMDTAPSYPPPLPTFRPKTPESSRKRMMSGPSSISRPKTPESRTPNIPVFKARTPERHRIPTSSSMPESESSSSLIGVKRRAPDDFDDGAAMPPQTFSADSAPLGYAADGYLPAQPTTPRLRKALQTMRTGFTPIRHTTRAGSASPRRATTGTPSTVAVLPTILDVTNSPRSSARHEPAKVATKKSWLGKIKGGNASSQPRTFATRQPLFDPPGMR